VPTDPVWDIPQLPFIFRPLPEPHNPVGIPDLLPFRLGVDPPTGRLVQLPTTELDGILGRAYTDGTMITGLIDEEGIGREYAEDFLRFVTTALDRERLDGLRVLEIGCGTGYLLHRIRLLGADVHGIEPGPQADEGRARFGIPIERGFFPGAAPGVDYDVAVLYCLLEHLPDPAALLREVTGVIKPEGTVLVAVPDEEPYAAAGEPSLLFHEHYSYFSARTLSATLRSIGARLLSVGRSDFSNLLLAAYRPGGPEELPEDTGEDVALARAFRKRAEAVVTAVWREIDEARAAGGRLGIFVPARAANVLAMVPGDGPVDPHEGIRLFDDNPLLHGTYYPGLPMPVESREDLLADPPDRLLIMSLSFGGRIAESLRPRLSARTTLTLLSDLV
jgi:SAM-dependent methyltransferase